MKIASTISRMLLATGALTLCLMGGVNIVSAEITSPAKQLTAPEPSPTVPETEAGSQAFQGYDSGA
jgi:hypothetical protein